MKFPIVEWQYIPIFLLRTIFFTWTRFSQINTNQWQNNPFNLPVVTSRRLSFESKNFTWAQSTCWGSGICKGKRDLTSLSVHLVKSTYVFPIHLEIPVGKTCTMFKPSEIISALSGDFRSSKILTNYLFWISSRRVQATL